ncbi:MAG: alpha-L-fucosidase [Chitinophagaceae bacterium]
MNISANTFRYFFGILFFFILNFNLFAQNKDYYPDPDTTIQKKLEEWQNLKFGLLMHWGPYSQWGVVESWSICPEDLSWASGARINNKGENYYEYLRKYEDLKKTFNPVKFNPSNWALAAKDAGMKYVVFTTKHHDGFSMFDTKYSDYKVTDKDCKFSENPKSNITKEIFSAFRKEGFWTGAYFSKPDWHSDFYWWKRFPPSDRNCNYSIQKNPDHWKKFVDYTHNQINELITDYGKIDILWLDGGWVKKKNEDEVKNELLEIYENSRWARNPQNQDINMADLVKKARIKQPGLIVVDRAVNGEFQNYLTPEQHIPEKGLPYPWETCMTMANSWSYVPNDNYKTTEDLLEKLADIVSKGGNLLLNIGPGPDGELDTNAYARLKDIGFWMKINGEAIYNTRMFSTFGEGEKIRYTQSKDAKTQFIFLFDFPDNKLNLKKISFPKSTKVQMLGSKSVLKWVMTENGIEITIPKKLEKSSNYIWVLKAQIK